jgi:two-component system chemotaxis response regulator CheY
VINKESLRILVADDEPNMRALLAYTLKSLGYLLIDQASDGHRAIEMLRQKDARYGLAFLDIKMPGYNGIEVMAMAREETPDCACIIVSADSALENVLAAVDGGASGFVVKPYTSKKIVDALSKFEREVKQ